MADIWSPEKRSDVMARIQSRDTKPELSVRKMLSRLGYRYRLNVRKLPGRPDIVLKKLSSIIFVHGCFWHVHQRCRDGRLPQSRTSYWHQKLEGNRRRDGSNIRKLKREGWQVLRLWECEIENRPEISERKVIRLLAGTQPARRNRYAKLSGKVLHF